MNRLMNVEGRIGGMWHGLQALSNGIAMEIRRRVYKMHRHTLLLLDEHIHISTDDSPYGDYGELRALYADENDLYFLFNDSISTVHDVVKAMENGDPMTYYDFNSDGVEIINRIAPAVDRHLDVFLFID